MMAHKILMIDDNHSFVDTLQVTLKGLPLEFENVFSYFDGEKLLISRGPRLVYNEALKILNLAQSLELQEKQKGEKMSNFTPLEIHLPVVQPQGFSLILVEQDTEPGRKGIDFIQNTLKQMPQFAPHYFWLLTTRPSLVEEKARQIGIAVFEKPVKNQQIRLLIQAHIEKLQQQEDKICELMETHANLFVTKEAKKNTGSRKEKSLSKKGKFKK
ncbi:MAG: hypothetical protein NZM25_03305 [Leptospiraceae bacterium]|nr:hypothetical protein [Leptospiraceae bacterium]MDW8306014.1 hypothetical protein [Leptospiraceae bacterium]